LTKQQNLSNVKDIHRKLGWQLLLNESKKIVVNNEKITLVGVENWGANNPHNYGDLDLAMSKVDPSSPINFLLSHDPSHWRAEVLPKYPMIDVTFSGHTHGGHSALAIQIISGAQLNMLIVNGPVCIRKNINHFM